MQIKGLDPSTYASRTVITAKVGKETVLVTALLRNVDKMQAFRKTFLMGEVYGDARGRWPDGTKIGTGFIAHEFDGGTLFETYSGDRYLVESWLYKEPIQRDPADESAAA
jgi:hypothetical protein